MNGVGIGIFGTLAFLITMLGAVMFGAEIAEQVMRDDLSSYGHITLDKKVYECKIEQ